MGTGAAVARSETEVDKIRKNENISVIVVRRMKRVKYVKWSNEFTSGVSRVDRRRRGMSDES